MTPDEQLDLLARYTVNQLNLMLSKLDPYDGATARQRRKWAIQLEETKRELIANGLAKRV
jgi:hypothetical protein